jgi:hypothetical protein
MTIYDIDKAILACVDEDGEIINIKAFEALQITRFDKIDGITSWHKQLIAEAEAIKTERASLYERQKQKENQAERLKGFLSETLHGEKFESARNKISWRKSEPVIIMDDSLIPREYMREKITHEPDKIAIKDAIKSGGEVPGAEIKERLNIQIK